MRRNNNNNKSMCFFENKQWIRCYGMFWTESDITLDKTVAIFRQAHAIHG